MAELRRDPLTHDWVIVAAERGQRPRELDRRRAAPRDERSHDERCPLCPGHESRTPPAVLVQPSAGPWRVRVVPNKYPIVAPPDGGPGQRSTGLLESGPAVGVHEVIVESPLHWRPIARMEPTEVELILWTYRERHRALGRAPGIGYVAVFKNHGPAAGTSLLHPHSQLVALPTVPDRVRRGLAIARGHRRRTGRLLHEDVLAEELRAGERLVADSERFIVHCPFASASPFAVQISPKVAAPSFGDLADGALGELAALLRDTLARLDRELEDPDFNYVLHSGLVGDAAAGDDSWRLALEPRLTIAAGFERGSGVGVNTVRPEDAAARLRR
ncbi:MAG TPA: galactose-1-phosphate uridylyltransferase [Chloroflexota bacterium]|jgi:UDPglucose--hexose-1-phosphate uridylyltransferase